MILEKNYPDPDFNETLVHVDLAGICGTDLKIFRWIYAIYWNFRT
ncbi:MAG: hypothetical protein CM1200mP11_0230 [Nitrosopumilaceae archaeon]|nr:MAG: hypothetical protein CM1200mP11_0230 [Nitrosopumilaceae archaeon]